MPAADAGFYVFQNPANGTVAGPDVACTACDVRASVWPAHNARPARSIAIFSTRTYFLSPVSWLRIKLSQR